jgi:flagellar basal body-associated protein FliL
MAEERKPEEAPAAAPKAKGSPAVLIMAVLAAVTVGATGSMFVMMKKMNKPVPLASGAPGAAGAAAEAAPPPEEPPPESGGEGEGPSESVITLAPFIINLEDEGEAHFLKVTIAVELISPKWAKHFEHDVPKVRNAVLLLLGNLKMSSTQGTENKKRILEQLRTTIIDTAGKKDVRDVYLTEFVIQ